MKKETGRRRPAKKSSASKRCLAASSKKKGARDLPAKRKKSQPAQPDSLIVSPVAHPAVEPTPVYELISPQRISFTRSDTNALRVPDQADNLLEAAQLQWALGEWTALAELQARQLEHHPDRAMLILLSAAARFQIQDRETGQLYVQQALRWGCDRSRVNRVLASGVARNLARAAGLQGSSQKSLALLNLSWSLGIGCAGAPAVAIQAWMNELDASPPLRLPPRARVADSRRQIEPEKASGWPNLSRTGHRQPRYIRSIHHFACTGGTLFAKCLAGCRGAVVLNEISPLNRRDLTRKGAYAFSPRDIISLLYQSNLPVTRPLVSRLFANSLETTVKYLDKIGKYLILRDHSHTAYCDDKALPDDPGLLDMLGERFTVFSALTVRHPLESFISLTASGWLHFSPPTLEEYACRYLRFLKAHASLPLFRYEDLVQKPEQTLRELCDALQMPFGREAFETLGTYQFSGDSGRTASVIEPRPPKMPSEQLLQEAASSESYQILCQLLAYPPRNSSGA
jgi:hypothetical protein